MRTYECQEFQPFVVFIFAKKLRLFDNYTFVLAGDGCLMEAWLGKVGWLKLL